MHDLSMAIRIAGRHPFGSPKAPLGAPGSSSPSSPACNPDRSQSLEATFRSPTWTPRFRATPAGSTLPACFFDLLAKPLHDPFDRKLPPHLSARGSAPTARCRDPARQSQSLPASPLPSGIFAPRDRSARTSSEPGDLPLRSARSSFAPRKPSRFIYIGPRITVPDPLRFAEASLDLCVSFPHRRRRYQLGSGGGYLLSRALPL
jgi:hypothetical protein